MNDTPEAPLPASEPSSPAPSPSVSGMDDLRFLCQPAHAGETREFVLFCRGRSAEAAETLPEGAVKVDAVELGEDTYVLLVRIPCGPSLEMSLKRLAASVLRPEAISENVGEFRPSEGR